MRQVCIFAAVLVIMVGCTPKETHRELVTFSYIPIDMVKIEAKDYSELINAVNDQFAPKTKEFVDARLYKEEGMYMYFRIYSSASSACYRVNVDRNRSKIINIQPDCPIDEE